MDDDLTAIVARVSGKLEELEEPEMRVRSLLADIERERRELDLLSGAFRVRTSADKLGAADATEPTYSVVM